MSDVPTGDEPMKWDFIISMTREQAIADGGLIPVSETIQREAGFTIPIAITAAVWESCVVWPDGQAAPQDEAGRLWDVLWMARVAINRSARKDGRAIGYQVMRVPVGGTEATLVDLVVEIGPGDSGEPVFTIRFPEEN